MDAHQLAKAYLHSKQNVEEQRRLIDYPMKKKLAELERDNTIEGKLRVIQFKSEIQAAEDNYEQTVQELEEIANDLNPILIEINANRFDPLQTHIKRHHVYRHLY